MFDFLFKKRSARKPAPAATPAPAAAPRDSEAQNRKQEELAQRRQQALQTLDGLAGQEAALSDFILHCEFADVRLKAAEQLNSAAALEPVLQAMRNSDRRVAKLAQARLKDLAAAEARRQRAQACVDSARQLQSSPTLALNKVAELDHTWQQLGEVDPALSEAYSAARSAIGERLRAQSDLQRALVQALGELRDLAARASELVSDEAAQRLEQLANEVAVYAAAPESHALPKHLLAQFAQEYAELHKRVAALQRRHTALAAREALLATWEAAEPDSLKVHELKRGWQALPALTDSEGAALQQRFDALLRRIAGKPEAAPRQTEVPALGAEEAKRALREALDALETAVQDGLLQAASAQDRILRGLDLRLASATEAQVNRLAAARAELMRLKDWAKWGGNVSREELIKAVEELPTQELPIAELAKRVGSSRDRWKEADLSAGPAPKALWERFDAACTRAYEPVAAHYKKLAEERQHNQAQAQGLLDDVLTYARTVQGVGDGAAADVDWKAVAVFCREARLSWKRVGTVERKEKKRLDAEFESALDALLKPLAAQRQAEIARREQLIAEAEGLNSNERNAVDKLRALQARWQEQAKALPLERADEQALWQRFRAACDAFFAKRKAVVEAADNERQSHLAAKEALCSALESSLDEPASALSKRLRETQSAWNEIGQVPRAAEQALEKRYAAAVEAVQNRLDEGKRAAREAQGNALRDKLRLCQDIEAQLAGGKASKPDAADKALAAWQALPVLNAADEARMRARFDAALSALQGGDSAYAADLKAKQDAFARALLRQEIVAGLDSPPELASERLKLQVEVLQDSLKSGQRPTAAQAGLLELCAMPVLVDKGQGDRLEKLLAAARG